MRDCQGGTSQEIWIGCRSPEGLPGTGERRASEGPRAKGFGTFVGGKGTGGKGAQVPVRLVKVLGMLGSDHGGERAAAALQATRILKEAGLTWYDVLNVKPE